MAAFITYALAAYSMYSSIQAQAQARKARKEAEAKADAAKGLQLPVEAQAAPLGVFFGRNLIGGVRVYHNTSNSFVYAAPAANCTAFAPANSLSANITGKKHEFLYIQQVLSCGELSRIISVDIDEMPYTQKEYEYGARINVYRKGSIADPLIVANDSSRATAKFPGMPYLSAVFRLNRDDPQYGGVPVVQVYAEGTPVENIQKVGSTYSITAASYSNNPARCLLHYLLNTRYGLGLNENSIDLQTFYDAIQICETVVMTNVTKAGRYWEALSAESRDIKMYECNLALDTSKSIRNNIEELLETMPGSDLVWSNGQYQLVFKVPKVYKSTTVYAERDLVQTASGKIYRSLIANNSSVISDTFSAAAWAEEFYTVTDDNIMYDREFTTVYPNAQVRLNAATATFLNEAKDFTEDTVTWPPKYGYILPFATYLGSWVASTAYSKGDIVLYNNQYYQLSSGSRRVNATTPNSDAVWKSRSAPNNTLDKGTWAAATAYTKGDIVTYNSKRYQLADGVKVVNATVPTSDTNWVLMSNEVYATYRASDSNVSLENSFRATGCVSYYNALALAEQKVRESREQIAYSFKVSRELTGILPGSMLFVNSSYLGIPGEMLKVVELETLPTGDLKLTAVKFDARTYAWNTPDDEVVTPRNVYDTVIGSATNLSYETTSQRVFPDTIATLHWDYADDARVTSYLIRYTTDTVINANTNWQTIGRTSNNYIEIPFLNGLDVKVAVISETNNGRIGHYSTWPVKAVLTSQIVFSNLTGATIGVASNGLSLRVTKSFTNIVMSYEIRKADPYALTDWNAATYVTTISGDTALLPFQQTGTHTFLVKAKSKDNVYSSGFISTSINITAPLAPAVTTQVVDNNVLLYWSDASSLQPVNTYELRKGSTYGSSQLIGTKSGLFTTVFEMAANDYTYWLTAIDAAGNYGTPTGVTVRVAAPPDYNMIHDTYSTFATGGNLTVTHSNCYVDGGQLVIPGNTSETVEKHFTRNLLANATDFGAWTLTNLTVLPDAVADPAGFTTADTIVRTATGNHFLYNTYSITSHANKTYTFSVWLKTGTMTGNVVLRIRDGASNEIVSLGVTPTSTWTRFSVTGTFGSAPSANIVCFIDPSNDTGVAGDTFHVYGAQLVAGSSPLSFWETPDEMAADGYAYFNHPVPTSATYTEILDFGPGFENNLVVVKVSAMIDKSLLAWSPSCKFTVYASTSADNITYSAEVAADYLHASGFRYVKFRIVVSSDTYGFAVINSIRYIADTKLKNEAGKIFCNASDVGGTTVTLNTAFYDIASIAVSPAGTTPITAVYDFVDAPNPTDFKILLFNTMSGARVSGYCGYNVKGY